MSLGTESCSARCETAIDGAACVETGWFLTYPI